MGALRRWEGSPEDSSGKIVVRVFRWGKDMKAAFGILALYVSIPLAIVAAQVIVEHEAAAQQRAAHAVVAQAAPAATAPTRH